MVYQLSNKIVDTETGNPIAGVLVQDTTRPANQTVSDNNGNFTITVDSDTTPIEFNSDNYGQAVGAAYAWSGSPVQLYRLTAPVLVKLQVMHGRMFPGTLITALAIVLFFKIFKII